jgi:heme exporter protein B
MVVVISLAFVEGVEVNEEIQGVNILALSTQTWNIIYWIILLFVAINAIAKSFIGERQGQLLYLYTLARPSAIIIAKMIYNTLLLILVGFVTAFAYAGLGGTEIQRLDIFSLGIVLGGFTFAANLTLVSAIASKAENKSTLLAVLSFPLIIPVLVNLIEITQKAIEGFPLGQVSDKLLMTFGISIALAALSVILFPFVWRD